MSDDFREVTKKVDVISRHAAIDELKRISFSHLFEFGEYISEDTREIKIISSSKALESIEALPSAQPERKTGHWLIREGISDAQCSECKMYFNNVYDMDSSDAFCRHCGAKMEGLKVVKYE